MNKTKIAIACQGGGSQTAFTSGVLQELFANKIDEKYEIVGISGTSGGALNAALAWNGLLQKEQDKNVIIENKIHDFWEELKASTPLEILFDSINSLMTKEAGKGHIPQIAHSPSGAVFKWIESMMPSILPRKNFLDFKSLINDHIDFELANSLKTDNNVSLFMGAANVLTGKIKVFNSRDEKIKAEHILASAAIPSIFQAVEINGQYYWDGLFSSNPPLSQFLRPPFIGGNRIPDEIWLVIIDPLIYDHVPETPYDILERRTQMTSNISLMHDLEKIALFSKMFRDGDIKESFIEKWGFQDKIHVKFRILHISNETQKILDYSTKLSRNPYLIDNLIDDGKKQAKIFVKSLSKEAFSPEIALKSIIDREICEY